MRRDLSQSITRAINNIVLFSLVLIGSSCEKEPFVALNGPRSFTFSRDGGTQSLTFTCNRDWRVSSSESWIQVSPSSGSASDEQVSVRVSCAANNTYDARSATLTIKVGELTETVSVSQDSGIGLLVSPKTIELTNAAQTIEIEVQKNVQYTVAIDNESAAWIRQGGTKALTTDNVSFIIAANTAYDEREGKITFKQLDGNLSETVVVRQSEANGLFITTPEYSLSNEAHSLSVEVKANVDFEVTSQTDWITYVETKALKSSTITLSILANEGYDSRTGTVLVKQKNGGLTGTITVTQKQTDYLEVTPDSFDLDHNRHEIELKVTQNVDYSVVIPEEARDWVHISTNVATKGLVDDKLIFVIDANDSDEERETSVTIKQVDGSLAGTVAIRQSEAKGLFITTPEYSLSNEAHSLSVEVKANVDFEVTSQADWITYVETKALKSSTITLSILANEGYDSRTGTVLVKQKNGDLTGTITVTQKQTDYLEVTPDSFDLDHNRHEIELKVTQNVDYSVVIPEEARDWVHISTNVATKGLVDDKLIFVIDANDSDEERETSVTVKQVDGSLAGTVAIRQRTSQSGSVAEAVDMGLSVMWATCNIGATAPEEYGGYFAWGETKPKSDYSWSTYNWSTYKWYQGYSLTKYNYDSGQGTIDNKAVLEAGDDVAHVKLGGKWRMPTDDEWKELQEDCNWRWTSMNGVNGFLVTSKENGNTIFLPAAGERYSTFLARDGSYGLYWSSILSSDSPNSAGSIDFCSEYASVHQNRARYLGFSVRPVEGDFAAVTSVELNKTELRLVEGLSSTLVATVMPKTALDKRVVWTSSDAAIATVVDGVVTAAAPGSAEITATCGSISAKCTVIVATIPEGAVNLGLSVLWATCNLSRSGFVNAPERHGGFFAWGETDTKLTYDISTYKWHPAGSYRYTRYNHEDGKTVLNAEDDAAHVKLGERWRMPTSSEWDELQENCYWKWTSMNGVSGMLATSKTNGNSIFLPAAGSRGNDDVGPYGRYWSSSYAGTGNYVSRAPCFYFDSEGTKRKSIDRDNGLSVRPVSDF